MNTNMRNFNERLPMLKHRELFLEKGIKVTKLNDCPPIIYVHGLLNSDECAHLINLGRPKLEPSTTVIANTEAVRDGRSSKSAFVSTSGQMPSDPVMASLVSRCSELTGYPASHFEGLKVVNYQKGQAYYGHVDFFGIENPAFLQECGDRMMTFFVYLNTTASVSDGGTTSFPKLGMKVVPRAGDAVFWMNMDYGGTYFHETIHSGDPVLGDSEKWGVNVWIRQKAYPR